MPQSQQQRHSLANAEDFLAEVLQPNYEAYLQSASNFASAVNLATALFHFCDWLFVEYKEQLKSRYASADEKAFWKKVEQEDPRYGYVRDVANASKHVRLRRPSTRMNHISRLLIVDRPFGSGPYGQGRFGGSNVVCDDGGEPVYFDECATALYDYWSSLLRDLKEADRNTP